MPRDCPTCSVNLYDQFGIYVHPTDAAWSLVEGGSGSIYDPVDGPTGLTSIWTYGGHGGGASPQAASGSYSTVLSVTGGASRQLSIVLDTATARSADRTLASSGTITNLRLVPYIGTTAQPALTVAWSVSPFDPDAGTRVFVDAGGLDLTLAANSLGAGPRDVQAEGIWGVVGTLPGRDATTGQSYTSYAVSFDYHITSHDLRGTTGGQTARVDGGAGLPVFALAAVALALVRRQPPVSARRLDTAMRRA